MQIDYDKGTASIFLFQVNISESQINRYSSSLLFEIITKLLNYTAIKLTKESFDQTII